MSSTPSKHARHAKSEETVIGSILADAASSRHRQLVSNALTATSRLPPEQQVLVSTLRDMTPAEAVAALQQARNGLPDSSHSPTSTSFMRLDDVLLPLLQLQREMEIVDIIGPYPDSTDDAFDVLISDIKPEDLSTTVSAALRTPYLDPAPPVTWPISGTIYGRNKRILFTLPVTARGKSVQVHFIFDTGAPRTYIALSVLEALGVPEVSLSNEVVRINGVKADVSVSDTAKIQVETAGGDIVETPCHFKGLNLMGMDFLDRLEGILTVNMAETSASLKTH